MKATSKLAVAFSIALSLSSGAADYTGLIPLQRSDAYTSSSNQSSFTNMLNTAYGWDDPVDGKGAAPRGDADYLVSDGKVLCTPYDAGKDGVEQIYAFDGRSLTLDGSSIYFRTAQKKKVQFADLRIAGSCAFNNNGWSYANYLLGKLTLTAGSKLSLSSGGTGHCWYFDWDVVAAADSVIACVGLSDWLTNGKSASIAFDADCTALKGTVKLKNMIGVNLNASQTLVPADFVLENKSSLNVVANSKQTAYKVNNVVCSNSTIAVAAGRTLEVKELVSDGATWDMSGGGTISVTDSFKVISPISVKPKSQAETLILTVPESAGKVRLGDFRLVGPSWFMRLVTENGVQKLYTHLRLFDAPRGYVTLTRTEGSAPSGGNYTLAYNTSGIGTQGKGWSDKEAPHPTTNYYCQYAIRTVNETFKGKSLTIGKNRDAELRVISSFDIDDLRMVSPCKWNTSGGKSELCCNGDMLTVGTTNAAPLILTGGQNGQSYKILSALHGMTDAEIACQVASTTRVGDGRYTSVKLLGDNSDYFGSVWVDYQTTLTLGSSMPGKVILGSDTAEQTSTLTTSAAAGKTIAIRALESDVHGTVNVPSGNTLAVEESLAVNKTLVKTGAGMLVLGGAATAGSAEAVLRVEAGSVKPLTTAATAVPIVFAGGSVTLDWKPTDAEVVAKGVDLSQADFTLTGDKLNVLFDFADWTPDKDTTYVRNVVTVKDADAAKLAGKIAIRRIKGHTVKFLDPVSSGGLTTFRVAFEPSGFIILLGASSAPVRRLFMAGDSTLDEHKGETNAKGYVSWGVRLSPYLKSDVRIVDYARSGFTTTHFMSPDSKRGDVNWWDRIKAEAHAGDYVMIQFGHNDQKSLTIAKFKENLATMVADVKAKGAIPVLVTPIPRLTFKEGTLVDDIHISDTVTGKDTLDNYAQAMRDVATETGAELADLRPLLQAKAQEVGETEALTWTVADDLTHPAEKGATLYASIFRDYIKASGLSFAGLFT